MLAGFFRHKDNITELHEMYNCIFQLTSECRQFLQILYFMDAFKIEKRYGTPTSDWRVQSEHSKHFVFEMSTSGLSAKCIKILLVYWTLFYPTFFARTFEKIKSQWIYSIGGRVSAMEFYLRRNSTLERCEIGEYMQFANVFFFTYHKFFTDSHYLKSAVELQGKFQYLHNVYLWFVQIDHMYQ